MITNLCITGAIGERLKENDIYRYILVDRQVPANKSFVVDKIPVCHWSKSTNNKFLKLSHGALITLTGRIENEEGIGLVVVLENYMILAKNDKLTLKNGE